MRGVARGRRCRTQCKKAEGEGWEKDVMANLTVFFLSLTKIDFWTLCILIFRVISIIRVREVELLLMFSTVLLCDLFGG